MPCIVLTCSRDVGAADPPLRALRRAGWRHAVAVVRPCDPLPDVDFAGLLLAGGLDVEPWRWSRGDGLAFAHRVDPERDEIELAAVREAWRRRVPILGLCRGAQLLAVSRGGTLISDIPKVCGAEPSLHQHGSAEDDGVRHDVVVTPRSRLHRVLDQVRVAVNSRHHQAVREPGDGLVAVAHDHDTVAPDGALVEAIEAGDRQRWAVGVQWHPENLVGRTDGAGAAALRLFARFGEAVATRVAARGRQVVMAAG